MAKKTAPPVESDESNQVGAPKTLNKKYEEWKVRPLYEKQRGDDGSKNSVCVGFEKDSTKPIRTTWITEDKADILNAQSENTGVRLYEVSE